MRLTRVLGALAIAAGALLPAHAQAAQSLAFTFLVPCDNTSPGITSTAQVAGTTLPGGVYAVTIAGACTTATGSVPVALPSTPCTVAGTTVPCVSGTVHGVPAEACSVSTGGTRTECGAPRQVCYDWYGVHLNEGTPSSDCVGQAGFFAHPGGVMTAQFMDGAYSDNKGYLVVTAVWTPLTAKPI